MRSIYFYITFFLFVFNNIGFGQSEITSQEKIYDSPRFNNQDINDFKNYIQNKIVYPEEAAILNLEGKTFYRFLIDFSKSPSQRVGVVDSLQVVKSLNPILDSIGFNLIKNSKEWTTSFARGKGINTWIVIPVSYRKPDIPAQYHINKIKGKYIFNSSEPGYSDSYRIQNTCINGLLNILPIAPTFYNKCKLVFSINDEGYINEFEIKETENIQFKSFMNKYVYSLPKINTQIQKYIVNDSCLQISFEFSENKISISPVEVVLKQLSISDKSQLEHNFEWNVPDNIYNLIEQSDSAITKTIFEYSNQPIQVISVYKSFNQYGVKSIKQFVLSNSDISNAETKYIYREYSENKPDYFEYTIIFDTLYPNIKPKKIKTFVKRAKMPFNAQAFIKSQTIFDIIGDTVITYNYSSNLNTNGECLASSTSYSKNLENGQLLEEGFQFTSGLFETQSGDNSDKLKYYNNNNIIVRMIKRNEGVRTKVYFKKNNKTIVYRIEDVYNDFREVINPNMTIKSFESYLLNNSSVFYKSIQFTDDSNRFLMEKYLNKCYFGTCQTDRMIDYQFRNNCN